MCACPAGDVQSIATGCCPRRHLRRRDLHRTLHTAWLLPAILLTRSAWAVVSIGAARDLAFAPDTQAVFFGYRPRHQRLAFSAGAWSGQYRDESYGATYHCGFGRISVAFGVTYLTDLNDINGTHWNFITHLSYQIGRHWSLGYRHISNGNLFFHWNDAPNRGWNFFGIDYLFDTGSRETQRTCIRW